MEFLKYSAMAAIGIGWLIMFIFAVRGSKPFKTLLLNSFSGAVCLAVINLTSVLTGVHIPLNPYTAAGSVGFGIPGVFGFLILQLLFK